MAKTWVKFYYSDWEGDAGLMDCSLAAQGLWLRMNRVMCEESPVFGAFLNANGTVFGPTAFARRVKTSVIEVRKLIAELERNGVFSRDEQNTIYSRRLVAEKQREERSRMNGKMGGNPLLLGEQGVNPDLNPGVKVHARTPEARYKIDSLRSSGPEGDPKEEVRQRSKPDTAWRQPLADSVKALGGRSLSSLNPEERALLGRYHAMEFANCRQREANNKAKGVQIAAGLASMGRSKTYGEITVLDYVSYAKRVYAARERTPFYDPWLIRSAVEFEG